jgi:very-short-patch-repair endonuclease
MTRAETILWTRLRRRQVLGLLFRRQMPIGPYIADFACAEARLVIEVDGETHSSPEQLVHDARRASFIEAEGWSILRIWNSDVYDNEDGVVRMIEENAQAGVEGQRARA